MRATYSMPATQRLDIEEREDMRRLEELEGGDISCVVLVSRIQRDSVELSRCRPLMILQKMHAADDILNPYSKF